MASSHGRGSVSLGPSSFSSSASVDSHNDTDLDDTEAEGLHLPFLNQRVPQQSQGQDPYPDSYSSALPELVYDYGDVRPPPPQYYSLSEEDKQYFDSFWTDFHEKQLQRKAQAPNPYINTGHRERSADDIMNGRYHQEEPCHDAHAYELPRHRIPLVNLVRNGWQSDSRTKSCSGRSKNDPSSTSIRKILSARRPRRWMFILFALFSLCVYWWQHGAQAWHEHKLLKGAVEHRMQSDLGYFGTNMLPEFAGMIQVRSLDVGLVPRAGNNKRLIVIGDVHGCVDELQSLLSKLNFKLGSDHLVFAGDLISKGPSSPAAVDLATASQASCVRGNHEDRVLLAYRDMQLHHSLRPLIVDPSTGTKTPPPPEPGNPNKAKEAQPDSKPDEEPDDESFLSGDHADQVLARSLSEEQIHYLSSCPVILDVGPITGLGDVRVVHAGLVPGLSLRQQDPISVMQMRTLDLETHVPSHVNDGTPWNKMWNKYQRYLPKGDRSTVIYGHDSKRGLQLKKYSKGLDTGCVKGGKLTALVLTSGNNKTPKTVQVDCRDYRPKRAPELGQS